MFLVGYVVALLTILALAVLAARVEPARALRYE
jgi:hypothetical protein